MLRLVYSSHTEQLLQALVQEVSAYRRTRGALEPVQLVLPNRNVEAYVRFGLAQESGIAANLEVHLLRRFVADLVSREEVRLVGAEELRTLVLGLLLDEERMARPEFGPVRAYLHAAGDSGDALDLRRFQLADQLSRLFEEYSFSRDAMLREWPRRVVLVDTPLAEAERWQRALWLELFGKGGVLERRGAGEGVRFTHPGALLETLRSEKLELPPRLFVFGISYVARVFQQVLGMLAQRTEVSVFTLNPCREFWEDVQSGRGARRLGAEALEREDPFSLSGEGDTPALRLWGRPGRENIRLLNELADCDFDEAFPEVPPAGSSLLRQLQGDILERAPVPVAPKGVEVDGSVQVLACPGNRREAEAVAEEIWALVGTQLPHPDPLPEGEGTLRKLRFNDIAVLVAGKDKEAYFSHLTAAFRACHDIPHNTVDLSFASVSRMAEGVGLLLAFPFGECTRPEVLRVLTHPAAVARFPGAQPEQWVEWCERLGVVHGADRTDHAQTYIDRDILNWDQGMRRLALGAFMTGARSENPSQLTLGLDTYFPEEHDRGSQTNAARLAMAVRSLIADARFARSAKLPLSAWARFLVALCEAYLAGPGEAEARELERCLSALRGLADTELGEQPVSYRIAYELAQKALSEVSGSRGQHLADGVVVATTRPMRAIPFKVVFLVGLGEGEFPAVDKRNPLDLRLAKPQAGDVSNRDQDRYTFLETLLCTRERLYLSYVSRDALTGEKLEPSPVVLELLQMLEQGYVGPGGRKRLVRTLPLHRHVGAERSRITSPEVHRESAAVALRRSLEAALGKGPLPELPALRRRLPPELRTRLDSLLGLCDGLPEGAAALPSREGPLRLSLSALRRFLECPLQGYAGFLLGLEDVEEGDVREREDEAFETASLDALVGLRSVFLEVVRGAPQRSGLKFEAAYGELAEGLARAARAPTGVFGQVERLGHLQLLKTWGDQLATSAARAARIGSHRFGGAQEGERVEHLHPPVGLELTLGSERVKVELTGRIEAVTDAPAGSLILQRRNVSTGWSESVKRQKAALRGYLDHLVLAAAGVQGGEDFRAQVLVAGNKPTAFGVGFKGLSQEAARAQLTVLATELLSGVHDYLLPCEAVFLAQGEHAKGRSLEECIAEVVGDERGSHSSRYGPIRRFDLYPPPKDAEGLVARRFGHFFAQLVPESEA
ncbi:exonuclease V subunit gamma [Aggregicoccus sp. 17bor-14]|uniref:exodeoxyribonuclease V subunit gamma n=1 Tax=Myxococcaceae TaxID=31 RepID=UPI00129CCC85|nr:MULTISPECIES: exodeoxyribonuclease V subunit gamma [Myxococcaceae]MBF5044757.1 exodeoxyribonuclease V subunit gamma [Simulacricoccus sp. 17bor-14]MRI90501.1 exonuclease V subunit gamma [Aggregicoccus sp. 17bor-14]